MTAGFGEAITTARKARGWTQEELAARADVVQGPLSRYENDLREPDEDTLERIANALGVTVKFLRTASRAKGAMAVDAHMRRRATAKPTLWRQLEARLNMYRIHSRVLMEQVLLRADQHIPRFDPYESDPATAARLVRMQWRMPIGPVRRLVRWLESAGCLVIAEDFGTDRVDGMSQWVDDLPIMLINEKAPTDRLRLTIAHELGHLVLHSAEVTDSIEDEANAFAAEFLMPAETIRPQLRGVRANQLLDLKQEWGVSMAALVERAYTLGLTTATGRTQFYKMMSARDWRTREPGSDRLPPERPEMTFQIADALLARGLTRSEIATMAGFAAPEDNTLFRPTERRLHAI
ncbi:MAG TPA: XRE family transcriptional regulator [Jatrophihabitans sp.]|nr:XRE family transcriptional regulator [Jatrophihabitans sp.]